MFQNRRARWFKKDVNFVMVSDVMLNCVMVTNPAHLTVVNTLVTVSSVFQTTATLKNAIKFFQKKIRNLINIAFMSKGNKVIRADLA